MAEATTELKIKVQIKKSSGDQQEVEVAQSATVAELKTEVEKALGVAAEA